MSRISVHRSAAALRGFTLVELMVAMSLAAIVFAGVMAAYLFLGHSLSRLVNFQEQGVRSRHTLRVFTQDISSAIGFSTATGSQLAMTVPTSGGTSPVSYNYASGNLTRTDATGTTTLLSSLTGAAGDGFVYYNEAGTAVAAGSQGVKSIEFTFTSAVGNAASGTLASYKTVSPRVLVRNKLALQ